MSSKPTPDPCLRAFYLSLTADAAVLKLSDEHAWLAQVASWSRYDVARYTCMANIADRWADRIGPLNQEEGIVVFHHLSRVTLNAAGFGVSNRDRGLVRQSRGGRSLRSEVRRLREVLARILCTHVRLRTRTHGEPMVPIHRCQDLGFVQSDPGWPADVPLSEETG